MTNIGIAGYGKVGKETESFFKDKFTCYPYDAFIPGLENRDCLLGANVCFVCVNTPPFYIGLMPGKRDMSCDISGIDDILSWITSELIVIKSTVPPGTTDKMKQKYGKRIIYCPEFCDIKNKNFFIFGGDEQDTKPIMDLYIEVFGDSCKYIRTTAKVAEMCKHLSTAYHINKRNFCLDMMKICSKESLDYSLIRELWLNDERVDASYTLEDCDNTMKKDYESFKKINQT